MPRPLAIESGSAAERVWRVWNSASRVMVSRMFAAEIVFNAIAIFGSAKLRSPAARREAMRVEDERVPRVPRWATAATVVAIRMAIQKTNFIGRWTAPEGDIRARASRILNLLACLPPRSGAGLTLAGKRF